MLKNDNSHLSQIAKIIEMIFCIFTCRPSDFSKRAKRFASIRSGIKPVRVVLQRVSMEPKVTTLSESNRVDVNEKMISVEVTSSGEATTSSVIGTANQLQSDLKVHQGNAKDSKQMSPSSNKRNHDCVNADSDKVKPSKSSSSQTARLGSASAKKPIKCEDATTIPTPQKVSNASAQDNVSDSKQMSQSKPKRRRGRKTGDSSKVKATTASSHQNENRRITRQQQKR